MDDQGLLLSVVATSRNDDHGANLKRRMQTFVNAFISQCKRHDLRAELILVEWNPPAEKPRLAEALSWPADTSPCEVRIIEVPEHLHRKLKCAATLPLFQMIGKNVGIRRARGRFVLATNIDIILNDELMRFLKEGPLEQGKVYRIDRTDVETDVPQDAPIEEQLAYCRSHHLRINSAHGTFPLTADGMRTVLGDDVATLESGIVPMEGASHVERDPEGKVFRWAGGDVRLLATAPEGQPRRLLVELSPGPCVRRLPMELEFLEGEKVVARGSVIGRGVVSLALPLVPGQRKIFRMRAAEGGFFPAPDSDCRILDFALHRLNWSEAVVERPPQSPEDAFKLVAPKLAESGDIISNSAGIRLDLGWHGLQKRAKTRYRWADSGASLVLDRQFTRGVALEMWAGAGPNFHKARETVLQLRAEDGQVLAEAQLGSGPHRITLPLISQKRKCGRVFLHVLEDGVSLSGGQAVQAFRLFSCSWSDAPFAERGGAAVRAGAAGLGLLARDTFRSLKKLFRRPGRMTLDDMGVAREYMPPRTHTNACGDFTLLSLEDWFKLGAYSELEMYSLHIDSLLMYAAHTAGLEEVVLFPEMRAYHIEHSAGSGWTPEGENSLFERLRAKGIPVLTVQELYSMTYQIEQQRDPRLFSSPNWGLASETLPETRIGTTSAKRAA